MRLWSNSFRDGGLMPADYAFAQRDPAGQTAPSSNRNPHLAWDEVPNGTESLALFCFDGDVPLDAALVNQDGIGLSASLPRGEFFHWSLIDLPPAPGAIGDGQFSRQITARGKSDALATLAGAPLRQGLNDYTQWFAADPDMAGDYFGYDGPCPPWNDERIHHYIFRLYALDTPRLALGARFSGREARAALYGHILDEAQVLSAYSLHPVVSATLQK